MDLGIIEHIQSIRGSLKPTLRVIADKVLDDPGAVRGMNVKGLAAACDVSEASISRFVRDVGSDNFRSFQLRLAEELVGHDVDGSGDTDDGLMHESIGRDDNASTILGKVVHRTADVARACLSTLSTAALEKAAKEIRGARAIYVFSAGLSTLAAENAVLRFSRLGMPVVATGDHNAQLLTASALGPGAVAIGISDSGRTAHTVAALKAAREANALTIAITAFSESPLAKVADTVLITPTGYSPDGHEPLHESMVSKFGQLLAVDTLYSLVAIQDYDASVEVVRRGDSFIQKSRRLKRPRGAE